MGLRIGLEQTKSFKRDTDVPHFTKISMEITV